jgi:hypothetical protein
MAKHEQQAYERLGAKVLTLPDVIAQSVGFMGPVFSSAFVIPLVVGVISASGKGGGVASPLSVLIAAVGAASPGRLRLVASAVIAILITAGAIFGSFYKVTSPTIYAPWIALAVLVIGFASTFVTRARRSASSELSDLTKSTA